ncbi:hypothetical protein U0C82_13340 [Fulvimarina sp. 2208YS6-2-32]|uniref:Lipoprotein n=1 Tax=Fulvimarina uroteuthidis TaxID=3098149 RepID=A0ABU5I4V2_9HYPH|nr:hypothetical protein [Fulvimarina sp. 2208YS6-2-32]MDY8110125.1 hypothetical protein [Fulvimarina sp. 2208YS6-2-32]
MPRAIASPALCLSIVLLLSACTDYANQDDRIYHGAGAAMERNAAIHQANSPVRFGGATDIWTDGKRAARAVQPAGVPPPPPASEASVLAN